MNGFRPVQWFRVEIISMHIERDFLLGQLMTGFSRYGCALESNGNEIINGLC